MVESVLQLLVVAIGAAASMWGAPRLGSALLARRGLCPGKDAPKNPSALPRLARASRLVCALAYGALLMCGGQELLAMAVLVSAFAIMQAVLYCDCLARVIPTGLAAALACCGALLCLADGGPFLLLARMPLAALAIAFLLACNLASRLRGQATAFGGGDLKTMPALALFGDAPAFLDGVLACSLFTACAGLGLALTRRKLHGVHVPLAPGMLVCLAVTTLGA